jgi:hypothetical protein
MEQNPYESPREGSGQGQPAKPVKRDLISAIAAIGAPAFAIVMLISFGWKVVLAAIIAVAAPMFVYWWMLPPSFDGFEDDQIGDGDC